MEKLGAEYRKAVLPFVVYAIADGRIVTGQNPSSGKAVAKVLLKTISKNQE